MEESVRSVYEDRLSELPESLIHIILSFLPIRDVVSTTLLSKRWENLWTTVPSLNFCEIIREKEEIYGIVDKVEGNGAENEDEGNVAENGDESNVAENEDEDNWTEDEYEDECECETECECEDEDEGNWTEDEDEFDLTEGKDEYDGTEDEDESDWTEDEDEDEIDGAEEEEDDDDDDDIEEEYERDRIMTERFGKFVNRALILWKGIKIVKFKIDIKPHFDHSSLVSDIHSWTLFAIKNKVKELELITSAEYYAPRCLYSCSSIGKLSLVGCSVRMDESPSWDHLKILRIHTTYASVGCFCEELINLILLGSPELEVFELQLGRNIANFNISSTSLKRLKFENSLYFKKGFLNTLSICCPNLEKLEISGLFGKCLLIDVSSLVDATLHLYNGKDREYDYDYYGLELARLYELLGEALEQVFSTIQHVEKVALSLCVQVFCASHKKYLHSPLPNVKFLKLDVRHIEFGNMVDLLATFPNLKMLGIEHHASTEPPVFNTVNYVEFETSLFKSFLLQLKIVEITVHLSDLSIFGFIEFLLKHAIMLEKLVIRATGIMPCQQ